MSHAPPKKDTETRSKKKATHGERLRIKHVHVIQKVVTLDNSKKAREAREIGFKACRWSSETCNSESTTAEKMFMHLDSFYDHTYEVWDPTCDVECALVQMYREIGIPIWVIFAVQIYLELFKFFNLDMKRS